MSSTAVVQYGRRKGSPRNFRVQEPKRETMSHPDLRQVTILPKSEWLRIQGTLNQANKYNESLIEAARQREAMHLRSKEVVKFWSNTIAGQRQKKLEAKKIREEVEEEERKRLDIEEFKYQAEKRKDAIEKAKAQQYYQTDRVKGFHSALLLTEVLKEREAQLELKRRIQDASREQDKEVMAALRQREEQAQLRDMEKMQRKKQDSQTTAQRLMQQMEEHERNKEQEQREYREQGEELKRLKEQFDEEVAALEKKQQDDKRNMMKTHNEHMADREVFKAVEAQKQQVEEEKRQLYSEAKVKISKMRKEKQAERMREAQKLRDETIARLAAHQEEVKVNEEELIARAIEEKEAREARLLKDKEEKKKAMLQTIAAHRDAARREQAERSVLEHHRAVELLRAKKEADRVFLEKQHLKAQRMREDSQALQQTYAEQLAEKQGREQRLRQDLKEFEVSNGRLVAEEERQFQQYATQVTAVAKEAGRDPSLLRKAAREGIGGGLGPIFGGVRPSYLVQDDTGVQMPSYVGPLTQDVREMNEATDIQKSKRRLGFTW
ncbi:cilia- and flagella- associated protein 210 [Engraulis encrasicolus]|uniref:cilia- and flagella- associated protein 210 n=1 Tax=Engraulis encrasicolus TaxID=184585 RepID=UPI002FD6C25E